MFNAKNKKMLIGIAAVAVIAFIMFGGKFLPQSITGSNVRITQTADSVTVCSKLSNSGSTVEAGILELQPSLAYLSFVSAQSSCDARNTQDVHKSYSISPGETVDICLTSSGLSAGTYQLRLVHAVQCCAGHPENACIGKDPYGLGGQVVGQATITGGQQCTSNYQKQCYGNNVYWYNSCGVKEGMAIACAASDFPDRGLCSQAACVTPPAQCGDGKCDAGESVITCSADCNERVSDTCGNGNCVAAAGETEANCPGDCLKKELPWALIIAGLVGVGAGLIGLKVMFHGK